MKKETLLQLATKINAANKYLESREIVVGKMLIEAQKRVHRESNMSFKEWAKNYLRKTDGSPWSHHTILYYIRCARNPMVVTKSRIKGAVRSSKKWKVLKQISHAIFDKDTTVAEQVNLLMTAWEHANEDARVQFLKMIGQT